MSTALRHRVRRKLLMQRMSRTRDALIRRFKQTMPVILASALFVLPIAAYVSTFGTELTSDHERWSQAATILGGLYTPYIGAATVYLLWKQSQREDRAESNRRVQHAAEAAEAALHDLLPVIVDALHNSKSLDLSLSERLEEDFLRCSLSDLVGEEATETATRHFEGQGKLLEAWNFLLGRLAELDACGLDGNRKTRALAHRIRIELGLATCIAFENALYAFYPPIYPYDERLFSNPTLGVRRK